MLVLGIESSCDETAVALVEDGRRVLASIVASQVDIHAEFGGVVPEVASREHLRAIHPLLGQALIEAGVSLDQVDAIAVTQGPGLIGAILVGVSFAKGLAMALERPLVPVDHVHAHVHGAILGIGEWDEAALYPTLALVVSGGHTNLYFMTSPTSFHLMASSVDDACGECFDKVAKLMGLPYPGGPVIERLARMGQPNSIDMPRMVERRSQLVFSYSGLKTHMANLLASEKKPYDEARLANICAAFQEEALGQLVRKLQVALEKRPEARALLVAGGVAANQRFRHMLSEATHVPSYFPSLEFCSDNAAMIAAYGYHLYEQGIRQGRHFFDHGWDAYSRYRYGC